MHRKTLTSQQRRLAQKNRMGRQNAANRRSERLVLGLSNLLHILNNISGVTVYRLDLQSTPALRTRRYYGHSTITDTQLSRTPRYYGHPTITDDPLLRTPRYYGHPAIASNPLLQTPHNYGHPTIVDTPLLRTPRY